MKYLVTEHHLSVKQSCHCAGLSRSAYYKPVSINTDGILVINVLNELLQKYPRWGFWKLFKVLRRKYPWNHKRVHRIYCQMKLNQKRRAKKRLPNRIKNPLFAPEFPNQIWSVDFVSDSLYCGKRFRTFNIIDDSNREVIHIEIDTSLTSWRLIKVFEKLWVERGLPKVLRCDNGSEFLGAEFVSWAENMGMFIMYIQPGKPNQNAYIKRFNRTYRTEVLNLYLFNNLEEVREVTYWWMNEYNEKRPHDALDDMTPVEYTMKNQKTLV